MSELRLNPKCYFRIEKSGGLNLFDGHFDVWFPADEVEALKKFLADENPTSKGKKGCEKHSPYFPRKSCLSCQESTNPSTVSIREAKSTPLHEATPRECYVRFDSNGDVVAHSNITDPINHHWIHMREVLPLVQSPSSEGAV